MELMDSHRKPQEGHCAACGWRPATVEVEFAAEGGHVARPLCEPCARLLMASQGQPGVPRAERARGKSLTPALDRSAAI
jgi:hypothetical protein